MKLAPTKLRMLIFFRAGRLIKSASLDGLWVSSSSSGRTGGDCGSNTAGGMSGNGMNPMLRGRGQYRQQPPSTDMEAAAQQPSVQQHEQHQQNVTSHGGTFVTSVKLSPSGAYVLLGCSRGNVQERALDDKRPPWQHPVAAIWRLGDMKRMSTLTSRTDLHEEDDANVALFHPQSGAGVVYGTKQGQIACALSPEVLEKRGLWLATNENIENMDETDDGDPLRSNFENEGNYEQRDHPYQ